MKVVFNKYRVNTTKTGWTVQHKVGNQWKDSRYHASVEGLVGSLLKEQFNKQSQGLIYYSTTEDGAFYLLQEVESMLNSIRDEIIGVYNG